MKQGIQIWHRKIDLRDFVGWSVFILVVLITCFVWVNISSVVQDNARKRFHEIAEMQRDVLINRMKDYEQVLLGAAGLFASSEFVDRREWRDYVDSLRLHLTLPGIQGVGYSQMVPAPEKLAHEAKIRAEGFPNYAISPPGERDVYSSIVYLEPFSGRNLRAFGFDMYSETVRRRAMQRAASTGEPAWSGKVTLVQEDDQGKTQPGFLVYVPIYAKNKPLRSTIERDAALLGFVYAPFRASDMLEQVYENPRRVFELQLFAGEVLAANLLYETSEAPLNATFILDLPIEIGGSRWTARFLSNANFNKEAFSELPLVMFLVVLGMECLLFLTFILDSRHRRRVEAATRKLEKSNHEIRQMSSLMQLLQNCHREEEIYPILKRVLGELFPGAMGACYLLNHSETQLEIVSHWGETETGFETVLEPESCWAFRIGQRHGAGCANCPEVRCDHIPESVSHYVCIPLLAQGKVIGVLYLQPVKPSNLTAQVLSHYADLLSSAADTISLSLSNLRLRNSLRDLSIRDSLTGLYNRRYMEEGLERELDRAQRQGHCVSVVMLDVDHFKIFNDTYGHDAGDTTLRRIADQMKHFRSGSDIVCRFGGEEFVLILPGLSGDALRQRLETLRLSIEAMQVIFEGRILPVVTVSMGASVYPADASEPAELIRLADTAMYRAKQQGRNRIEYVASAEATNPSDSAGPA